MFLFLLVEVRQTFDVMKFYQKTDIHMVYVTTQDAVTTALRELSRGKRLKNLRSNFIDSFCVRLDVEIVNNSTPSQTNDNQV